MVVFLPTTGVISIVTDNYLGTKEVKELRTYKIVFVLISIIAVASGLVGVGAAQARQADRDTLKRLNSFGSALTEMGGYNSSIYELPQTIDKINTSVDSTGITYERLTTDTFELCATFKTKVGEPEERRVVDTYFYIYDHKKGKDCFKGRVELADKPVTLNRSQTPQGGVTLCGVTGNKYEATLLQKNSVNSWSVQSQFRGTESLRLSSATKYVDSNCSVVKPDTIVIGSLLTYVGVTSNSSSFTDLVQVK